MRLANRERGPLMTIPPAKRTGCQLGPAADFLSGLPGIGSSFADAILKNSGSAAHALELLTGRESVPNVQIGQKRRERIRNMLGLKGNQKLRIEGKNERVSES